MAISEGRPQHAFNLLPKCDECRQQSGHLHFIYFYPKKIERKSANDSSHPVEIRHFSK